MTAAPEPQSSSAAVTVVRDVVTVVTYVGLLLAAGLALFVALVLPRTWAGTETRARLRRLLTYAAAAGAAGIVLQVPVSSVYGQGLELTDVVSAFDPGLVGNELLSALLVLVGLGVAARSSSDAPPDRTRGRLLVGGAVLALVGPSLVGHTRAFAPSPLLVAADVLHLAAGATWLGGLVGLVVSLRALAGREVLAATTLARFSTLAGGLLLAVAATGTFLAWRIVGSWSGLVETRYGWLLLAKVAIALLVAALGGWNRWRTLPAVERAAGFGDRERRGRGRHAHRAGRGGAARRPARRHRVPGQPVTPPGAGHGRVRHHRGRCRHGRGPPRAGGDGPAAYGLATRCSCRCRTPRASRTTRPRTPSSGCAPRASTSATVVVRPIAAGTYRGEVVVPRAGEWEVQVGIALSRFDNPVTTVTLTVSTVSSTGTVCRKPSTRTCANRR